MPPLLHNSATYTARRQRAHTTTESDNRLDMLAILAVVHGVAGRGCEQVGGCACLHAVEMPLQYTGGMRACTANVSRTRCQGDFSKESNSLLHEQPEEPGGVGGRQAPGTAGWHTCTRRHHRFADRRRQRPRPKETETRESDHDKTAMQARQLGGPSETTSNAVGRAQT